MLLIADYLLFYVKKTILTSKLFWYIVKSGGFQKGSPCNEFIFWEKKFQSS